jgi:hypothetical protein
MELLGRDRTICGGLFTAQRVRNRCLTSRTLCWVCPDLDGVLVERPIAALSEMGSEPGT